MLVAQSRHTLSSEQEGYTSFKEEAGTYALVHIPSLEEKEGKELLTALMQAISSQQFSSAIEFESAISELWKSLNFPLSFSLALIHLKGDLIFLKTHGEAKINLRRGGNELDLVANGAYAAGKPKVNDEYHLSAGVGQAISQAQVLFHDSNELVSSPAYKEGVVKEKSEPLFDPSAIYKKITSSKNPKQIIGVICLGAVALFLLLGGGRSLLSKSAKEDSKNIQFARELITQKLEQADDVVSLNSGRATALIIESKNDLKDLEKKLNGRRENEVKKLTELISDAEKKILQKNYRSATEYFDLSVEEKGAQGTMAWRYDDKVVIINPKGVVYILSLERKSLESRTSSAFANASYAGLDESTVFVYKNGVGIIASESEESKPVVRIKPDKEWGSITDIQVFNKNIYLLDSRLGQIHKYIPADDGFASRSAYLQSSAYAKNASSFAIDQSVYIAQSDLVTKYTGGLQDGYAPQYPDEEPIITRVITAEDLDSVYLWDKKRATITTLSKSGNYEGEVESPILGKATSVVVYKNAAYALQGSKLYQVLLK